MSRDRTSAKLSSKEKLMLIEFVHRNECLWKNLHLKNKRKVHDELYQQFIDKNQIEDCSARQLKQCFVNLKDTFYKK